MKETITHGTYRAYYWHRCRCDLCREFTRARVARNRAERLASGNLQHGTRSAYDAGCRCDPCKGARREARIRLETGTPRPRAPRALPSRRDAVIEDYLDLRSWGVPDVQAATRLGVSTRTLQRYKQSLQETT